MSPFKEGGSPVQNNPEPIKQSAPSMEHRYVSAEARKIEFKRGKLQRLEQLMEQRKKELEQLQAANAGENKISIKQSEIKALQNGIDAFVKELAGESASAETRKQNIAPAEKNG